MNRKTCETCGNEYDNAMAVVIDGKEHFFDCFECAIHMLAPTCAHCSCKVIGHGVELNKEIFCCSHCLQHRRNLGEMDYPKAL